MSSPTEQPPQLAVWYFVGATFVFISPSLFFHSSELWLTILTLVAGMILIALGGVQLGREISARRRQDSPPPPPAEQPPA